MPPSQPEPEPAPSPSVPSPSPQNPNPPPVPEPAPQPQQPGGSSGPSQPVDQPPPVTNDPSTGDGKVNGQASGPSAGNKPNDPSTVPGSTSTFGNKTPSSTGNPLDKPNNTGNNGNSNGNGNGNPNSDGGEDDDDMNNSNPNTPNGGNASSGLSNNRTLIITLSIVLSVVAFLIVLATILVCYRIKKGRLPFIARGISPIGDEEIESWKRSAAHEKYTSAPTTAGTRPPSSTVSTRKPPSVIVYQNAASTAGAPELSPKSIHTVNKSIDLPQAAVLARAPNSRPGLTDDTVEGDQAFIPTPKRQHSRLSKSYRHVRSRSSQSSMRGAGFRPRSGSEGQWPGSSPRASNEYAYYYPRTSHSYDRKHARIYSDSSNPPRASFDDEFFMGALSPRPLLPKGNPTPESQIGRAIG